jgi:hypothetical protein
MAEALKEFTSIESLLDANLDDLADLPAFEAPPPGAYILSVNMDVKKVNDKDAVEAAITVVETVELEDKSGETKEVAVGTKTSQLFMIDNEFGVGKLKTFLKPFAAHFGTNKIGELVRDHVKDVTISATIKNRKDKTDPDKVYASFHNISVN